MTARHRVSKMLLRHGRVYPKSTTWTAEHRRWLSRQQFDEPASELVFADLLAAVDGLSSRKAAIALRLSGLATDERWWPTVARLRSFRGVDTLTALSLHLELGGDWHRFERPSALSAWLGLTPSLNQSGESSRQGSITKTGSMLARRLLVESAWHYSRAPRLGATLANRQHGQPDHILQIANRAPATPAPRQPTDARPRQAPQRHRGGLRPRAVLLSLGRRHRRLTAARHPTGQETGAPGHQRPARAIQL
jgi:transposase